MSSSYLKSYKDVYVNTQKIYEDIFIREKIKTVEYSTIYAIDILRGTIRAEILLQLASQGHFLRSVYGSNAADYFAVRYLFKSFLREHRFCIS